jgi:hypothetical protein
MTPCGLVEVNRRFRKNVLPPSSGLMRKSRKQQAENRALHAAEFLLIICLTCCLTLKTDAVRSSETSVISYWSTRRHISGVGTLHSQHREDIKFNAVLLWIKSFLLQWLHRNSKHNELTNLMEKSPSWETASCATARELPSMLWNPQIHYPVHRSPPLVHILSQINPVHTTPSHLSKINFNIILTSTSGSS